MHLAGCKGQDQCRSDMPVTEARHLQEELMRHPQTGKQIRNNGRGQAPVAMWCKATPNYLTGQQQGVIALCMQLSPLSLPRRQRRYAAHCDLYNKTTWSLRTPHGCNDAASLGCLLAGGCRLGQGFLGECATWVGWCEAELAQASSTRSWVVSSWMVKAGGKAKW